MATLIRIVVGLLIIAHGLVHLLYVADDVPEFTLERSWIVPEQLYRPVGLALMYATVAGFFILGLAVLGVPGLSGVWPVLTVVAVTISLVLLIAFWNTRLIFGVLLNLVLITIVLVRPGWTEQLG
ncbi:MAG TPA: hypothetical protein VFZ37_11645 [Jiangellaceae bacterium]